MNIIVSNRNYEEAFTSIMEILSKHKEEDVYSIAVCAMMKNRQWYTFFWNADAIDKFAFAGIMQNEAQDELDGITHDEIIEMIMPPEEDEE